LASSRLQILPIVQLAYRDFWRICQVLPGLVVIALLVIFFQRLVGLLIVRNFWTGGWMWVLVLDVFGSSFFLTPVMIAVHRFVVLDEAKRHYSVNPRQSGFMTFFGWMVALSLSSTLGLTPSIAPLMMPVAIAIKLPSQFVDGFTLLTSVAFVIVWVRLAVLFPAVAIRSVGANAANAVADSRGHALSIFLVFLLALLPWIIGAIAVTRIFTPHPLMALFAPLSLMIIDATILSAIHTIALMLSVSVASRLFQNLANRLSPRTLTAT